MNSTHYTGLALVLFATLIEAFGQISLKKSALTKTNKQFWLCFGLGCLVFEAIVWTVVLHVLDLSVAYPMGSLTFVLVAFFSQLLLDERIARIRWLGVCFILCGTALVGA